MNETDRMRTAFSEEWFYFAVEFAVAIPLTALLIFAVEVVLRPGGAAGVWLGGGAALIAIFIGNLIAWFVTAARRSR